MSYQFLSRRLISPQYCKYTQVPISSFHMVDRLHCFAYFVKSFYVNMFLRDSSYHTSCSQLEGLFAPLSYILLHVGCVSCYSLRNQFLGYREIVLKKLIKIIYYHLLFIRLPNEGLGKLGLRLLIHVWSEILIIPFVAKYKWWMRKVWKGS